MADTKFIAPLEGAHVNSGPAQPQPQPAQEQPQRETGFVNHQYVPPSERVTLHKTRLGAALARRDEAKAAAPAPVPQQSQTEALSQQIATLQTAVSALAASQIGNAQRRDGAPEREAGHLDKLRLHNRFGDGPYVEDGGSQWDGLGPNPLDFDFYDDVSTAEFRHLTNGHIQREAQRLLEAERAAQQKAAEGDEWGRQGAAVRSKFGRDKNFNEAAQASVKLIVDSGFKLNPEEAYLQASAELEARNGKRRSSYLPDDVKTLGDIMRYNRDTGRVK